MVTQITSNNDNKNYPKVKVKQINELVDLINKYDVIALSRLDGISSNVIQDIRANLRGKTVLKVSKNTLKKLAINSSKKSGIEKLNEHVKGSVALVFSNENPFNLQRFLLSNTVPAAAKIGQVASNDVIVPAGNTDLNPGPVIGELNSVGIRTKVEKGKITIIADSKIISEGDVVNENQVSVLNRLGIKPFTVGLTLAIAFEKGEIVKGSDLIVDEEAILGNLVLAHQQALGLAIETVYITEETIKELLAKANREAVNLSVSSAYPTVSTIKLLIAKANNEAVALEAKTNAS